MQQIGAALDEQEQQRLRAEADAAEEADNQRGGYGAGMSWGYNPPPQQAQAGGNIASMFWDNQPVPGSQDAFL